MRALEELTEPLLDIVRSAIGAGAAPDPTSVSFLLGRYHETDEAALGEALGVALAAALARYTDLHSTLDRVACLTLFADATALSDDERLRAAAHDLANTLMRQAAAESSPAAAASIADACLRTGDPSLIPDAVDLLESVVSEHYEPGEGMAGGTVADQVRSASALLTAFDATGRLPYAMLAEELMRTAQRHALHDASFADACEAARVLCRLAKLHGDDAYRASAVLAADADYRADAERILSFLSSTHPMHGADAARYGLALAEYVNLK
jgi:uncharacterized protein YyaL (SSP411 family)